MKSANMTNSQLAQDQPLASPANIAHQNHPIQTGASNAPPQTQTQTQMITTKTGKILDPQQMHVCRLCDKLLSSSSSLDRHMLTHSGERPFLCKRCHMTFTTNGNMHRHMRTHLHKDSLARQQQEQMQLKQSLLADGGGGGAGGSMTSAGGGDLNSTASQQQQVAPGSFTSQRNIFSPVAVGPSPVAPAVGQFHTHSHANHQPPANSLMSAPHMSGPHMAAAQQQQQQQHTTPLVGPLASLLGAASANHPGNQHMQALLLNQHLVAAMLQQQQQQSNMRHGSNKLEINNLGIQSGPQDHRVTGDISAHLFQNQQAALAAAASQLMQQQQRTPVADLDTKSLMMSAALAAASQDPQASLESVKAVMLAAAAAAAAAATSAGADSSKASNQLTNHNNNNNNLLMELPIDQQQRATEPSRNEQRVVRGKRRKQIKPLRSHQQIEEEDEDEEEGEAGRCRTDSGDERQQHQQQHDHSGASSLIEDLLAGCEARAKHEDDRGREPIASCARLAVKLERELSASPRQQQREDFNNNNQPARAARVESAASSFDQIIDHYSRSRSSSAITTTTTTSTIDQQQIKACHLDDSNGHIEGPGRATKSERRLEVDQESGTDIDDQEDLDEDHNLGEDHQRYRPGGSPRTTTKIQAGDKNNNNEDTNKDQGASPMALRTKHAEEEEEEEEEQFISHNIDFTNNNTNDSFEDQDYSNTNTSSNSGDRRQSSSFVSSSREIADHGEDEEGEQDDERLMMFGTQNRASDDKRQQQQLDDDDERGDSRSGITQLGPGDEDDEIIEDISQSYVKTANPNATRKGGKRNRHCYKCKLCTYSSVDRCTLVRHLRIHSGERPYICGICRYAFTTKANCERHVRKRHKKQYNSLGGSGGVKGSNGGGRSLIITDHSNHQTIPVKVNPVAAQTISQTLRRIQEKEQQQQQQQQLDVHDGLSPGLDLVGTHHQTGMLNDDNIERIGHEGTLGSNNIKSNSNLDNDRSSARTTTSTRNGKRKHRSTIDEGHDQDMPAYQRRRHVAGKHQLTPGGDHATPPMGILGGLMGLPNEQQPIGYEHASIQAAAANFLGVTAASAKLSNNNNNNNNNNKDTTATTNELFANLLAQIQQINNNNDHIATTSTSSKQRIVTSDSPVSNATFLANMLAASKAMAASSETSVVQPVTGVAINSLLSTKNLSHQFAQLRNLNQQSDFFKRRNPFDPFSSLDLAAQALDLSCSQQPGHK